MFRLLVLQKSLINIHIEHQVSIYNQNFNNIYINIIFPYYRHYIKTIKICIKNVITNTHTHTYTHYNANIIKKLCTYIVPVLRHSGIYTNLFSFISKPKNFSLFPLIFLSFLISN